MTGPAAKTYHPAPQDPNVAPKPDPLPEPLPMVGDRSPCSANDCRACCFDTRMPLLEADLKRLEAHTGRPRETFSITAPDEPPRLKNEDGHCVFLGPQGCTVYNHRPAGCRLYPLVLDPERGQGVLDDECPYRKGFRIRPRDRAALQELVDALGVDP